ncbi:MAG: hypothetical protein ACUVRO_10930 [Armatimonadota bacterium]
MTATENALALVGWTLLMAAAVVSCLLQAYKTTNKVWRLGWLGLLLASLTWLAGGVLGFASHASFTAFSRIGTGVAIASALVLLATLVLPRKH